MVVVVVVVVVEAMLVEVVSCVTTVRRWLLVVTGEVTVVPPEVIVISGVAVVVSCVVERFAATTESASCSETYEQSKLRLKCDCTRAETRFRLPAKGRVYLNQRGRQFSRLLAADVCASAVVMLNTPCSEVV